MPEGRGGEEALVSSASVPFTYNTGLMPFQTTTMWLHTSCALLPPVRSQPRLLPFPSYMRKFHPVVGLRWKKTQPERGLEETRLNSGEGPTLSSVIANGFAQYSMVNGWFA